MEDLYKPTIEDLQPTIDKVGDLTIWKLKFINQIIIFLAKNPLNYRGYGPYWWLVKKAIIEHGETRFGDFVDAESAGALAYRDSAIDLIAAFSYYEQMFDLGKTTSSEHIMSLQDGDSIDYIIADDEMEMLHATNQL